jgi:hypothetical protein
MSSFPQRDFARVLQNPLSLSATMRFTPAWEGKVFIIEQRTDARRSVTGDDGAAEAIVEAQASDVGG